MKAISQLMQEIVQLTAEIETKYPELYRSLEETPLTLAETKPEGGISTNDLQDYLETLKSELKHHIETHGSK